MKVKDCMVIGAAAIEGSEGVVNAARLMAKEGVGMLVVEDGGKLAGIVTDRDIVVRCVGRGDSLDACRVRDHMSTPVTTVTRDADIFEAAELMRMKHVKRLPVVDGGTVVGVVSITDLTQAMDKPLHDLLFGGGRTRSVPVAILTGQVTHYFTKLRVAALNLAAPLHVGDQIRVIGHTTDLAQEVTSMEVEHKKVEAAYPGDDVAIGVEERVRVGDSVYIETN